MLNLPRTMEKGISKRISRARSKLAVSTRAAGVMLLLGAALIVVTVALPPAAHGSDLLILGYGAVLGVVGAALLARRRISEPVIGLAAALATVVITLATLEAGRPGTGAEDNQVLYLWVCVYAFWFFSIRHALLQVGLIGAADAVLLLDEGPTLAAGLTRWLVVVATFVTVGLLIAWLRRALERRREETAALAMITERMRIARELHDAAGHGMTAVSIQAAAGLRLVERDTEAAKEALEEIVRTSKLTLEDMRRLLGVLRPASGDSFDRVSLARLDELVARCRRAGVPIEIGISGEPYAVPETLDQAAYRIIEEALTNVLEHGGAGAKARLRLSYDAEGLGIEVTNKGRPPADAPPPGAKGLSGIRERVELFGGLLETGPLDGGGFRVHARLPVKARVSDRS